MIFQSLGSNFTLRDALTHMATSGSPNDAEELKSWLENHFGGEAQLFYRGRSALAEAVQLATNGVNTVAINGFTCYAVVDAVKSTGAGVIYVDISENDLHFGATELSRAVQKHENIKAIVIQNTFGISCDIHAIEKIARINKLIIIEDLAHCIGGVYRDGREMGTVGDLVVCSFGRDKIIDAVNGGALIVRDRILQKRIRPVRGVPRFLDQLRDKYYPLQTWYVRWLYPAHLGKLLLKVYLRLGFVLRSADGGPERQTLPNWYCVQVLRQLKRLNYSIMARNKNAKMYQSSLKESVKIPLSLMTTEVFTAIRFPLLIEDRKKFLNIAKSRGIHISDTWYDTPIAPRRFMEASGYIMGSCPVAESIAARIINLPTHKLTTVSDIKTIINILDEL